MVTMAQVMARAPQTVCPATTVGDAARRMREADTDDVVVVDQGRVVGILTDRDLALRVVAEDKDSSTPVGDICRGQTFVTIGPDVGIGQAMQLMRDRAASRLLVAEEDRIIGVISLADLNPQGRLRN